MMHKYDQVSISQCLSNRTLHFIGDSTVRQVFWAVAAKHDRSRAQRESVEARKHEDLSYRADDFSLLFIWDPYANTTQTAEILSSPLAMRHHDTDDSSQPWSRTGGVILGTGLWHARYGGEEFSDEHRNALERVARYRLKQTSRSHTVRDAYLALPSFVILPPPILNHEWLNPERAITLNPRRLEYIVQNLLFVEENFGLEIAWSARAMTANNSAAITTGGLHVTQDLAAFQAEILLNRFCNNLLFSSSPKATSLSCTRQSTWTTPWGSLVSVLVVITLLLLVGAQSSGKKTCQLQMQALGTVMAVVQYCWLADRTVLLGKGDKLIDIKTFVFLAAFALAAGLVTFKTYGWHTDNTLPTSKMSINPDTGPKLLPRVLTDEWKGWMQVVILLYHYFGMSKILVVYQVIRVLVASYLFLTGYGHASYFLRTKDFSFKRVVAVLLRLNLLACLLSATMGNTYHFYYFPSLATSWFLVTYAIFWRRRGRQVSARELAVRMLIFYCIFLIVVKNQPALAFLLDSMSQVHGPRVSAREFIFRFQLDIVAPFGGMIFSILESRGSVWENMTAWSTLTPKNARRLKVFIRLITPLLCTGVYLVFASRCTDKYGYNAWHWIMSMLPIISYIIARNGLWRISTYFSPLFVWIGSFSLELFVLQYHIWLAADSKGLLRLGLVDTPSTTTSSTIGRCWTYWSETAITTLLFIWLSKQCSDSTNVLVRRFVEFDKQEQGNQNRILLLRVGSLLTALWLSNLLPNGK